MKQSKLSEILTLNQEAQARYASKVNIANSNNSIFGGQVLAQALLAAYKCTEARPAHSLHAYFLRAGDANKPVVYEIEALHDGKTVSSRRVIAKQEKRVIFHLSASFHSPEQGYTHQKPMSKELPRPKILLEENDIAKQSSLARAQRAAAYRADIEFLETGQSVLVSKERQAPYFSH